jgi:hypothetical protein
MINNHIPPVRGSSQIVATVAMGMSLTADSFLEKGKTLTFSPVNSKTLKFGPAQHVSAWESSEVRNSSSMILLDEALRMNLAAM